MEADINQELQKRLKTLLAEIEASVIHRTQNRGTHTESDLMIVGDRKFILQVKWDGTRKKLESLDVFIPISTIIAGDQLNALKQYLKI